MELLVFVSSNCPHCPRAERIAKELSVKYVNKGLMYRKIRTKTPEGKELSQRYSVMASPTLLFLDESGKELKRIVGVPTEESLKNKIEKLLGIKKSFFSKFF